MEWNHKAQAGWWPAFRAVVRRLFSTLLRAPGRWAGKACSSSGTTSGRKGRGRPQELNVWEGFPLNMLPASRNLVRGSRRQEAEETRTTAHAPESRHVWIGVCSWRFLRRYTRYWWRKTSNLRLHRDCWWARELSISANAVRDSLILRFLCRPSEVVESDAEHREDAQYLSVSVAWCACCVLRSFLHVRWRYVFGVCALVVYDLSLLVRATPLYQFKVYENMQTKMRDIPFNSLHFPDISSPTRKHLIFLQRQNKANCRIGLHVVEGGRWYSLGVDRMVARR